MMPLFLLVSFLLPFLSPNCRTVCASCSWDTLTSALPIRASRAAVGTCTGKQGRQRTKCTKWLTKAPGDDAKGCCLGASSRVVRMQWRRKERGGRDECVYWSREQLILLLLLINPICALLWYTGTEGESEWQNEKKVRLNRYRFNSQSWAFVFGVTYSLASFLFPFLLLLLFYPHPPLRWPYCFSWCNCSTLRQSVSLGPIEAKSMPYVTSSPPPPPPHPIDPL